MASLERSAAARALGGIDVFDGKEAVIAEKRELPARKSLLTLQAEGWKNQFLK